MTIDGHINQLPDIDPGETSEWLDSLEAIVETHGKTRARYLIAKLLERANELQVGSPAAVSTPYVNTIPPEREPWFPGDEHVERRIRAYIRWNAAVMVVKANKKADGIGGHLATFASSASLYEVGFNHFFRGKADGTPGDHVYFQGHAAPGIYARAFLEGRLSADELDRFRMEVGGGGLSSYPHPRLMPDFWEYPTVSMGLGADQLHLRGPVPQVPPEPAHRRHQPEPGVVLHRRRRDRRARDPGLHLARRPRGPRQPHVGRQLQPPAPRRARSAATARSSRSSRPSSGARAGT